MGITTALKMFIMGKILDGVPLTPEETQTLNGPDWLGGTPLQPLAPTTEVVQRKQVAGSQAWQMQQLLESEQRSDGAGARARNRLMDMARRGKLTKMEDLRDPTKSVHRANTPAEIAGAAAPVYETPDPLYSRSSKRPENAPPHVVERMTPEQMARQQAGRDNLNADAAEERPQWQPGSSEPYDGGSYVPSND